MHKLWETGPAPGSGDAPAGRRSQGLAPGLTIGKPAGPNIVHLAITLAAFAFGYGPAPAEPEIEAATFYITQ
jgi:hypothetical protein